MIALSEIEKYCQICFDREKDVVFDVGNNLYVELDIEKEPHSMRATIMKHSFIVDIMLYPFDEFKIKGIAHCILNYLETYYDKNNLPKE